MTIKTTKKFEKQFQKISPKIVRIFERRVDVFTTNPFAKMLRNHALTGQYRGYRSINITGDIRVVYSEIKPDTVEFHFIGTHAQLYD